MKAPVTKPAGRKSPAIIAAAIAAIVLGNALLLLALEFGFRLLAPFPTSTAQTYRSDPKLLYSHMPDSVGWEVSPIGEYAPVKLVYDNAGFRGAPLAREKPPGEFRIFALGDSIVEGRQVPEQQTLSSRLEQLLGQDGVKARVINAGVSAYTTTTMNLMLRNHVREFAPDIVVAFVFANDYADNFVYGNYSAHPELLAGTVPADSVPKGLGLAAPATLREWLTQNSAIYATLAQLAPKSLPDKPDPVLSSTTDFLHTAHAVNKANLSEAEQRLVDFTHAGLQAMAEFCAANEIGFLAVVLPWPPQISPAEWGTGKSAFYGYGKDETDPSDLYQRRLKEFAAGRGIATVDLLERFRAEAAASASPLFLPYDGHLTARGHDVVARTLLPRIETMIGERRRDPKG